MLYVNYVSLLDINNKDNNHCVPYFKKIFSSFEKILQWAIIHYDDDRSKNNECKVAIPSEFFIKISSQKYKISYKLVSLIMHDGNSLDSMSTQEYDGSVMMKKSLK